jgi:hypothetical protein
MQQKQNQSPAATLHQEHNSIYLPTNQCNQSMDQQMHQPTNQSTNQPRHASTNQSIKPDSRPAHESTNQTDAKIAEENV